MKKTIIAIPQMGYSPFRIYMKSKYVQCLHRAGARVRWISLRNPEQAAQRALRCDGLLLPGGSDIAPALYGQSPLPACGKPNTARDRAEPGLLRAFLDADKPVFAVCRGIQVLNVARKGTLLQDIAPLQKTEHNSFSARARGTHAIEILPDSLLAAILGTNHCTVNSLHHQAIDAPGEGLRITARSEDGFAEAAELPGQHFCLGVQWHPEHMSLRCPSQQALYKAFVDACRCVTKKESPRTSDR